MRCVFCDLRLVLIIFNKRIHKMKKTALAALTALIMFSRSDAMNDLPDAKAAPLPRAIFHCTTKPPVDLVRDNGRLYLGGLMCPNLSLTSKNYNGIPMLSPLVVQASMSDADISAALQKSFGCKVTVKH
jgi:hypothetical protein